MTDRKSTAIKKSNALRHTKTSISVDQNSRILRLDVDKSVSDKNVVIQDNRSSEKKVSNA